MAISMGLRNSSFKRCTVGGYFGRVTGCSVCGKLSGGRFNGCIGRLQIGERIGS